MKLHYILAYRLDLVVFAAALVGCMALALRLSRRHNILGRRVSQNWTWTTLLIVAGGVVAEVVSAGASASVRESVRFSVADYAFDLAHMGHKALSPDTRADDELYLELVSAEEGWLKLNKKVLEIYTVRRMTDGRFASFVHTARMRGPNHGKEEFFHKPIGSSLSESDDLMNHATAGEAFVDAKPVAVGHDMLIRAVEPMVDSHGKVEAILRVDLCGDIWFRTILSKRLSALAWSFAFCVFIQGYVYIARQRNILTAHSLAESKLRESENRFRSLFENLPNIAVQGYDLNRRVIFWNEASAALYGYSREEAMGMLLEDLIIPPPMRADVVGLVKRWLETGTPIPAGELVLQKKDGRPVKVFSSHVMQIGSRGEPEMYCVDVELTERDQALAALADSEANYRALFEVVPHPMWVYDFETLGFLAVNSAAVEHYGFSREEFLKLKLWNIFENSEISALHEHLLDVPLAGSYGPVEWRNQKKNGEPILVETISHSLAWTGRRARIVLAQDVSLRRKAEQRIREQAELLDKTTEAIVAIDALQNITFWNRGATKLLGLTAEQVQGRSVRDDLLLALGGPIADFMRCIGSNDSDWHGEISTRDAQGRVLFIEINITVVRDAEKRSIAYLSVSSDITKRKALEAQMMQAQKMEVLGQLAGGVAHDFNSILMAMSLHLEMLKMDLSDDSKATTMLGELRSMTERAAKLVGQLLLFARKHTMTRKVIDLNGSMASVTSMLQRLLGAEIPLKIQNSGSQLWIKADASMLDQVVMNLCVNARDAMPDGGIVTIETSQVVFDSHSIPGQTEERPGTFACLRVSDTGSGMSDDVLAHLFEPFFTTKEAGRGTGLGLATVHGIVHQHKGWITVESVLDKGSTFSVYLPVAVRPDIELVEPVEDSVPGGDETILLVEDDEFVRRTAAAMLLRIGYRVLPCSDAKNALRVWQQNSGSIDLILSDIVLPGGMNGLQLVEKLLVQRPSLAVVFMSGYNDEIMKSPEIERRGFKLIPKPMQVGILTKTIRSSLDQMPL